jgi:tetratricopeptide (TPR) repeat protein
MTDTQASGELQSWHREAEQALNARDYRRAHELCLRILTSAPDFADAFFLLGVIAAEHGNFAKAADVIARALRLDGQRAEYHAQLARCLLALNEPRKALQAASRALDLQPRDALTLDTIGVVMSRAGAYEESLEPFRRAVALDASKPAYFYNLGASLQFVGDLPAAERAFRSAIALDPGFYKAWSSLGQVSPEPFTAGALAHLEKMLAVPDISVESQLHVCHALARHYEQHGDYPRSFQYLERGKHRKRASIDYSFDTDRALFEAAARVCSEAFLKRAPDGVGSEEPIFIVGLPRTGTTLVERILSSHPQVYSAGELTNFSLALKRATETPSNLVIDVPTLEASAHVDFAKLGRDYLESTRPRTGHTPRFIDKMPLNFLYAGLIHRALPRAKIICLRRNPLDSCLSNYRQLFATTFSYYHYAYDLLDTGRYYIAFDSLARQWAQTIPPHDYCEVHYEAVVEDTERQARRLLAFCGIPWDPSCLSFHENAAPVSTASSVQVRQPIYRSAVGRWRKYERELASLVALFREHGIPTAPAGR